MLWLQFSLAYECGLHVQNARKARECIPMFVIADAEIQEKQAPCASVYFFIEVVVAFESVF